MNKKFGIIIGVIVAIFLVILGVNLTQNRRIKVNYDDYDLYTVIEPSEANGNLGDMVEGDKDAPVLLFEYGDYQCDACAPMNPYINQLIEEYDGKLALVFRTDIMDYHQNGTAAAAAANAAAMQGYWREYKDKLYSDQDDWFYSNASTRQGQFERYFTEVSKGQGDMEKFRKDMRSREVTQKITFDNGLSEKIGVEWTPSFYIDGERISQRDKSTTEFLDELRAKIDAILAEKGIAKPKKSSKK